MKFNSLHQNNFLNFKQEKEICETLKNFSNVAQVTYLGKNLIKTKYSSFLQSQPSIAINDNIRSVTKQANYNKSDIMCISIVLFIVILPCIVPPTSYCIIVSDWCCQSVSTIFATNCNNRKLKSSNYSLILYFDKVSLCRLSWVWVG